MEGSPAPSVVGLHTFFAEGNAQVFLTSSITFYEWCVGDNVVYGTMTTSFINWVSLSRENDYVQRGLLSNNMRFLSIFF